MDRQTKLQAPKLLSELKKRPRATETQKEEMSVFGDCCSASGTDPLEDLVQTQSLMNLGQHQFLGQLVSQGGTVMALVTLQVCN